MHTSESLLEIYTRLHNHFGSQDWWPGDTPFEIMVGAILTQNTNWQNVEKAIANLKAADLLSFAAMSRLPVEELAGYIRPAGYYNIKADRLRNFFTMVEKQWDGDLDYLLAQPTSELREQLLSVKGIGPETADSMMLYAAEKPIFVVDTYTHRILLRHEIISEEYGYFEIQEMFMDNLEEDSRLFNEYHALLVQAGKHFCKKSKPKCVQCPLSGVGGVKEAVMHR
ncbi:MAG: endonuclease III domain-containing protein [Desulfobulbaceae bacterium]|nr:endonuclease III domain-containing protein [Desulfobulbaceae bacterium]